MRKLRFTAFALTCAALAACGGGGGSSVAVAPRPVVTGTGTALGQTANVSFRIVVSGTTTSAAARKPNFVSPATQSVTVTLQDPVTHQNAAAPLATINLSGSTCQTSSSGTICTVSVAAPVGSDTFVITCYSQPNGAGSALSTVTTVPTTIAINAANSLSFTLNGVVATAAVILGSTSVLVGTPATITVSVVGYDAAGNVIIGSGNFSPAITLANSDTSGATSLSTTSVTGPGTPVTLAYTGGSLTGATITPSVGGTTGTAQIFAPTGTATATYALPGSVTALLNLLAVGPDGNTWFSSAGGLMGPISAGGVATVFDSTAGSAIFGMTRGLSDGFMYFGDLNGDLGLMDAGGNTQFVGNVNTIPACGTGTQSKVRKRAPAATRRVKGAKGSAFACSFVNWMITAPDGTIWYNDGAGDIGSIVPGTLNANEYDITMLPGWNGGSTPQPLQMVLGTDGAIYIGDTAGGIDRVTISGSTPTGVTQLASTSGCSGGIGPITMGSDGNLWFADACNNLGSVPVANFTTTAEQFYTLGTITGGSYIYMMTATPGSVWFVQNPNIGGGNQSIYRVSSLNNSGAAPIISSITPQGSGADYGTIGIGNSGNVWAGNLCPLPNAVTKVLYGAPPIGAAVLRKGASRTVRRPAGARWKQQIQNSCPGLGGLPSSLPSGL